MTFRFKGRNAAIALVATCMLVLQSVAGAFALGAGTGSVPLDAFGNPLCLAGSDGSHTGNDGSEHTKIPNCCALGCGLAASSFGTPPDAVSLPVERKVDLSAIVQASSRIHVSAHGYEPGNPRAPPLTA
ncbi:DUF2946 family protein [Pseudaminobacter sp. NGMCC 1.201702]|uniref:DUF2946 family protein n=1 Tax=Pseudaminobacter sp. NGMCC 1.201702 TaxID=3391825 RepID=UPI0039EEF42E